MYKLLLMMTLSACNAAPRPAALGPLDVPNTGEADAATTAIEALATESTGVEGGSADASAPVFPVDETLVQVSSPYLSDADGFVELAVGTSFTGTS
jgi:hypothetical protein